MVVVGGPRAEQTQGFMISRFFRVVRMFGEVFVDLVPEGCPNPPEGCPKPLGFWFWTQLESSLEYSRCALQVMQ